MGGFVTNRKVSCCCIGDPDSGGRKEGQTSNAVTIQDQWKFFHVTVEKRDAEGTAGMVDGAQKSVT